MNDIVNYKKRKNTELFKSLERFDLVQTQNYIPIYTKLIHNNCHAKYHKKSRKK